MNLATTPDLRLRPPRGEDAAVLLAFESRNRAWFEAAVNARPPSYYSEAGVHSNVEKP